MQKQTHCLPCSPDAAPPLVAARTTSARPRRISSLHPAWPGKFLPLAGVVLGLGLSAARADTFEWANPVNGLFTTAGNWVNTSGLELAPPNAGDTAVFNEAGAYTVTLSATPVASDSLQVVAGTVTFRENVVGLGIYNLITGVARAQISNGGTLILGVAGDPATLNIGDDLLVQNGGSLQVLFGSDVTAGDLFLGITGSGTTNSILVDGAGSTFTRTNSSAVTMGQNGATGNLTLRNGASGDINAALFVASSGNASSAANVFVQSGAALELDSVVLGGSTANAVPQGLLEVTGTGSTITQTGASPLTVGLSSGNIGVLNVKSNGVYTTGTGITTVNATGTINVDSGTLHFGGNLTLNGGDYLENQSGSASRSFASNSTVTIQNGGQMTLNASSLTMQAGRTLILDGSTSGLNLEGSITSLIIGGTSDPTTSRATIRNNASLTIDGLSMRANPGQMSVLNILSGGRLALDGSSFFSFTGDDASNGGAIINVDGASSDFVVLNVAGPVVLGRNAGSTAQMNLSDGGRFISDDNGLEVRATGTISLDNGALLLFGDLVVRGGAIVAGDGTAALVMNGFAGIETRIIEGGSALFRQDIFELAGNSLLVEGPGSSFAMDSATPDQGNLLMLSLGLPTGGVITVRDGATLDVGSLSTSGFGFSTTTTNTISLASGGTAMVNHLGIGLLVYDNGMGFIDTISYEPGLLDIAGPASRLAIRSGFQAHIGSALYDAELAGVRGTVHLTDGGELDTTAGTLLLNRAGIIHLDGGVLKTGPIVYDFRGDFNFTAGTLSTTTPLVVGNQQLLGPTVQLAPGKHLVTTSSTTVSPEGTLILNGGSLTTGSLTVSPGGGFQFLGGTLNLTASPLTLGTGGLLGGSLQLGSGSALAVGGAATLAPESQLDIEGGSFSASTLAVSGQVVFDGGALDIGVLLDITAGGRLFVNPGRSLFLMGNITNAGRVELLGGGARLIGPGTLANTGLLTGDGQIGMALANLAAGEIRATDGRTISFTAGLAANAGLISLLGGTVETAGALTNGMTGDISGRGVLDVGGGGLLNAGDIAFSNGYTDIFGDVSNQAAGRVIISGNADVTFWGDAAHAGALFRVAAGSSATFFGQAGFSISGGGDVFFEDDITPGSSPGLETFGGNVFFGPGSSLKIEVAGAAPGTGFDRLEIQGATMLDGTLVVTLLDGYDPQPGDTFSILAADEVWGNFTGADFSAAPLDPGLGWQVEYQPDAVNLKVVITDAFLFWINSFASLAGPGDMTRGADPDFDTLNNLSEFALDGNPSSGLTSDKIALKIAPVGGVNVLTVTFPVRIGAVPAFADPPGGPLVLEQTADGVAYSVSATDNLPDYPLDVLEVTGSDAAAIQAGLPALNGGWQYRTFRTPGSVTDNVRQFISIGVSPLAP